MDKEIWYDDLEYNDVMTCQYNNNNCPYLSYVGMVSCISRIKLIDSLSNPTY